MSLISVTSRLKMYEEAEGRCFYCGTKTKWEGLTVDHVQPKAKGGKNHSSNYVLSCEDCNQAKADMSIEEFDNYLNHLHIIMRKDFLWRILCKHFTITIRRKTSFTDKINKEN